MSEIVCEAKEGALNSKTKNALKGGTFQSKRQHKIHHHQFHDQEWL